MWIPKRTAYLWLAGALLIGAAIGLWRNHGSRWGVMTLSPGLALLAWGAHSKRADDEAPIAGEHVPRSAVHLGRELNAAMLVLDEQDCILHANTTALGLLEQSMEHVRGKPLKTLLGSPCSCGVVEGCTAYCVHREDRPDLYAQAAEAPLELPHVGRRMRMLILHDVTALVHRPHPALQEERLRAAATLASHFAHEVRNPVAAISGSAQVLDRLQRQESDGTFMTREATRSAQAELYRCIVEESNRLDSIIARFLAYPDLSDTQLEAILDSEQTEAHSV